MASKENLGNLVYGPKGSRSREDWRVERMDGGLPAEPTYDYVVPRGNAARTYQIDDNITFTGREMPSTFGV